MSLEEIHGMRARREARGEDGHLCAKEGGRRGNWPCRRLDLGLSAPRSVRNQVPSCKPLSVGRFVRAAGEDAYVALESGLARGLALTRLQQR